MSGARILLLVVALFGAACSNVDDSGDATADAAFMSTDGKADDLGVSEGSPTALAVLELANTATLATLDDDVQLDRRAAQGIVDRRPFATLAELDAVPWVGPVAFGRLVEYVQATGLVDTTITLPQGFGSLTVSTLSGSLLTARFPDAGTVKVTKEGLVAANGRINEELAVAADRYLVYLGLWADWEWVSDQEREVVEAARIEVPAPANCGPGECEYTLRQFDADHSGETPRLPMDTGVDVLAGPYILTTFFRGGEIGWSRVEVSEGELLAFDASFDTPRIKLETKTATLPDCVDQPGVSRTYDISRWAPNDPVTRVRYVRNIPFSNVAAKVFDSSAQELFDVPLNTEFAMAPGRYILALNATLVEVDVGPEGLTTIELGRLEVLDPNDSAVAASGDPGTFAIDFGARISLSDVYERWGGTAPLADCPNGTGLDLFNEGRTQIHVHWEPFHRNIELTEDQIASPFDPIVQREKALIGTPTGGVLPDWQPVVAPEYVVEYRSLGFDNGVYHAFWWKPHARAYRYVGTLPLGTEFVGESGQYMFVLNNSVAVVELEETTAVPVGRIEVSDFFTNGTYAIEGDTANGADTLFDVRAEVGTGINVFEGEYRVHVEYNGGANETVFDVAVP